MDSVKTSHDREKRQPRSVRPRPRRLWTKRKSRRWSETCPRARAWKVNTFLLICPSPIVTVSNCRYPRVAQVAQTPQVHEGLARVLVRGDPCFERWDPGEKGGHNGRPGEDSQKRVSDARASGKTQRIVSSTWNKGKSYHIVNKVHKQ